MTALSPRSRAIVATYARLNGWLPLADIQQEAALAALEASATWREDGGTTLGLWVAWKVGLALSRYVAEVRCPTSLPKAKRENWHEAATARRAPLTSRADAGAAGHDEPAAHDVDHVDVARVAAESWETAEERIDRERAIARIRAIMAEQAEAARQVLLADERPRDVARQLGLAVETVYNETRNALRALRRAFAMEAA